MTPATIEEYAVPEAKIVQYLLNPVHPKGGPKSAFFLAFGFQRDAWQTMAAALCLHPAQTELETVEAHPLGYGEMRVHRCQITTPDGRNPCIRSVWKVRTGSSTAEFVTAYPADQA